MSLRRVQSTQSLAGRSALRSATIGSSRSRKVSWAPDLPLASASYLDESNSQKPLDFLAFIDEARKQSQKRGGLGNKLNKPRSRRPSHQANSRFNSYYDSNFDRPLTNPDHGTPERQVLIGCCSYQTRYAETICCNAYSPHPELT